MTTIHLEPNQVPSQLRGAYTGRKFRAVVVERMLIPETAGLWDGGSRDVYQIIRLADGAAINPVDHNLAPWAPERRMTPVTMQPGFAVVCHSMFCGKDAGLTFYVHPVDAAKLIAAPKAELTDAERFALAATAYKSGYAGRSRYQIAADSLGYSSKYTVPSESDYETAKESLIARGFLDKRGAITVAGRNARS